MKKDNDRSHFALLLVDVQKDFWPQKLAELYPDFPNNISNLLSLCRQNGVDVIHIRAEFEEDMSDWMPRYRIRGRIPCVKGTDGITVLPCAGEATGEKVFTKQTFDGFHNTGLFDYLQEKGKKFLLVAGLVTSTCVLFTASSATQLGFLSAVIRDCCADEPSIHDMVLERYQFIFNVVESQEIMNNLSSWTKTMEDLDML